MLNQAPEPLVLPMQELHLSVVGRYLGVPTSFFNVEIEGARYLARVKAPHKDRKDMLWMKFAQAGYGDEAFAPLSVVQKWLISDDEALDPKPASVNEATRGVNAQHISRHAKYICHKTITIYHKTITINIPDKPNKAALRMFGCAVRSART